VHLAETRRALWNALPSRTRQRAPLLALTGLLALLAARPSLLGFDGGRSASEPEPSPERPLARLERQDPQALEKLNLSKGDRVELVLANGTYLEGDYLRVEPPTASNPEMYVLLIPKRENGRRPSPDPTPRQVPFSEVRTLSVKVPEYAWIAGGAAVGVALDAFIVSIAGALSE
jgi:hypothetical protein